MPDFDRSSDENVYDLNAILHPGSVFYYPRDVLADTSLLRAEKGPSWPHGHPMPPQ